MLMTAVMMTTVMMTTMTRTTTTSTMACQCRVSGKQVRDATMKRLQ